jgi:hypothetical protein
MTSENQFGDRFANQPIVVTPLEVDRQVDWRLAAGTYRDQLQ